MAQHPLTHKSNNRGFGGRQAGPDPRNVPGLSAAKARRILAKRESAARSNFKKKAAALVGATQSTVCCAAH